MRASLARHQAKLVDPAPRRTRPRLARTTDNAVQSQVADMQAGLFSALNDAEDAAANAADDGKWSPRRTFGFVALSCGSFWALVGFAVLHYARP